jgi:hypothetical protein
MKKNWKVNQGMVRPEEAVDVLTRFVAWAAEHAWCKGHTPHRVITVEGGAAISCEKCLSVFILALPWKEEVCPTTPLP